MTPPFYVLVQLLDSGDLQMSFPFMDADTLSQAQDKALYWYTVYNRKKGSVTASHFTLNHRVFTDDKRYSLSIHQYPF